LRLARAWPGARSHLKSLETLPQHQFPTPRRHRVSDNNTQMAAPTKCMATAMRNISSPQAARVTHRTFAFSTSSPVASSRKAAARNLTCRRELQTTQMGLRKAANSCWGHKRCFSQSAPRSKLKTIDQIRARNKGGVRFDVQRAMHQMQTVRRPFKADAM
jgi:hypothetical protein